MGHALKHSLFAWLTDLNFQRGWVPKTYLKLEHIHLLVQVMHLKNSERLIFPIVVSGSGVDYVVKDVWNCKFIE